MLFLTENDVDNLITMPETIEALERAFNAQDSGHATNRARDRVRVSSGVVLHVLPAGFDAEGVVGFKAYTSSRTGARFLVVLYSSTTGQMLAMIEADRMGQLRTGAASGLATRYMATESASAVGLFGSGYQAETQLEAVCAVRKIKHAFVYSRSQDKRDRFASLMSERLDIEVKPTDNPEEAAGADIVITATTAREPVLKGEWLKVGCHINAAGANSLARRELDDEAVKRAAIVAADSREQALREAADLISPLERGWLTLESVRELREVVTGARPGRTSGDQITLFKSLGIGLEDLAAGALVYRKAIEQGVGTNVPFLDK